MKKSYTLKKWNPSLCSECDHGTKNGDLERGGDCSYGEGAAIGLCEADSVREQKT